jgi:hypothetical protein
MPPLVQPAATAALESSQAAEAHDWSLDLCMAKEVLIVLYSQA